jgi:hypothetical protein
MTRRAIPFLLALLPALLCGTAWGDNVDLVTLPNREGVQLTIYNSEDITFVKERRHVTVKRGANRLQFSWANTLIDPSSVEFRALEHADDVEVADTVFPGQKPQFLVWNVESRFEGQLLVEVSYFTSGLTWTMDYVGVVDPDEERMDFRGHVRVFNNSGEEYEDAEIRLIVGKINLVEKIADLARRRGIPVPRPGSPRAMALMRESAKTAFDQAARAQSEGVAGEAKGIVKEGISEYFMFTVEGTETVRNGWSKRMRAVRAEASPFDVVYRMRAHQYGPRPVRFFVWRNDEDHELGESPLPDGRIRIFRENGQDGLSYLGEQLVRYVPIEAPIEVNVGTDDLVVYETRKDHTERFHFTFHNGYVVGWDTRTRWIDTVRNYRDEPIVFELRRQWPGDVEYESAIESTLFDYRTVQATFAVPARGRVEIRATVLRHEGRNARQDRVRLD